MINLSSAAVMIKAGDGTSSVFEPEELQARLVSSCIASGVREFWLAEDLVNAVESALLNQSAEGVSFEESEVDAIVARALEEAGYPEVAEKFRSASGLDVAAAPVTPASLRELLGRRLMVDGTELDGLVAAVLESCATLGVTAPDQALLLELGRHFKQASPKPSRPPLSLGLAKNARRSGSPWLALQSDLAVTASAETRRHLDAGVLSVGGISRLFPSVKIDLHLVELASLLALEPPVTELALLPRLSETAKSIEELVASARQTIRASGCGAASEDAPVYLRFADVPLFTRKCLAAEPATGERICAEIADHVLGLLATTVTVRGVRRRE